MKKTFRFLAMAAVLVSAAACVSGGKTPDSPEVAALKPSKALQDSVSYMLGLNYGVMLKQYNFGEVDYKLMVEGMKDFVNAKGSESDSNFVKQFKMSPEDITSVINKYLAMNSKYESAVAAAKEKEYFEKNKETEGIVETGSGLQYVISEAGSAEKPGPRDTVYVHYTGTLLDGTVFDEVKPEAESAMLTLNRVIPAWTEGIQLIGEGGKIKLYVPAALGYGERNMGVIPANSTLIFDVQLDSLRHYIEPSSVK